MRNIVRLTLALTLAITAFCARSAHAQAGQPTMDVLVHLEGIGDRVYRESELAGTSGESRRLEGFAIRFNPSVPNLGMIYMAHLEDFGDTWASQGQFIGTRGQSRRLEGFAIQLTGAAASNYNVWYMAHVEGYGDTGWYLNGEFCGTRGQSRRVEAMRVVVLPKGRLPAP